MTWLDDPLRAEAVTLIGQAGYMAGYRLVLPRDEET